MEPHLESMLKLVQPLLLHGNELTQPVIDAIIDRADGSLHSALRDLQPQFGLGHATWKWSIKSLIRFGKILMVLEYFAVVTLCLSQLMLSIVRESHSTKRRHSISRQWVDS